MLNSKNLTRKRENCTHSESRINAWCKHCGACLVLQGTISLYHFVQITQWTRKEPPISTQSHSNWLASLHSSRSLVGSSRRPTSHTASSWGGAFRRLGHSTCLTAHRWQSSLWELGMFRGNTQERKGSTWHVILKTECAVQEKIKSKRLSICI